MKLPTIVDVTLDVALPAPAGDRCPFCSSPRAAEVRRCCRDGERFDELFAITARYDRAPFTRAARLELHSELQAYADAKHETFEVTIDAGPSPELWYLAPTYGHAAVDPGFYDNRAPPIDPGTVNAEGLARLLDDTFERVLYEGEVTDGDHKRIGR